MMGVLGGICIVIGCGSVWHLQMKAQRNTLETLHQLSSAMLEIRSEIQSHQTPLPRIFQGLSQHYPGKIGRFFQMVRQEMAEGTCLLESWSKPISTLSMSSEMEHVLLGIGRSFSGNEEQICKVLLLASDCIEREIVKLNEGLPNQQRSCGALCFSGGALLFILLL